MSFTPDELGELKHLVKTIAGPRVAAATIVQAKAGYCPLSTTKPRASKKEPGHRRPSVSQLSVVLHLLLPLYPIQTAPTKPSQPKTAGKATERLVYSYTKDKYSGYIIMFGIMNVGARERKCYNDPWLSGHDKGL